MPKPSAPPGYSPLAALLNPGWIPLSAVGGTAVDDIEDQEGDPDATAVQKGQLMLETFPALRRGRDIMMLTDVKNRVRLCFNFLKNMTQASWWITLMIRRIKRSCIIVQRVWRQWYTRRNNQFEKILMRWNMEDETIRIRIRKAIQDAKPTARKKACTDGISKLGHLTASQMERRAAVMEVYNNFQRRWRQERHRLENLAERKRGKEEEGKEPTPTPPRRGSKAPTPTQSQSDSPASRRLTPGSRKTPSPSPQGKKLSSSVASSSDVSSAEEDYAEPMSPAATSALTGISRGQSSHPSSQRRGPRSGGEAAAPDLRNIKSIMAWRAATIPVLPPNNAATVHELRNALKTVRSRGSENLIRNMFNFSPRATTRLESPQDILWNQPESWPRWSSRLKQWKPEGKLQETVFKLQGLRRSSSNCAVPVLSQPKKRVSAVSNVRARKEAGAEGIPVSPEAAPSHPNIDLPPIRVVSPRSAPCSEPRTIPQGMEPSDSPSVFSSTMTPVDAPVDAPRAVRSACVRVPGWSPRVSPRAFGGDSPRLLGSGGKCPGKSYPGRSCQGLQAQWLLRHVPRSALTMDAKTRTAPAAVKALLRLQETGKRLETQTERSWAAAAKRGKVNVEEWARNTSDTLRQRPARCRAGKRLRRLLPPLKEIPAERFAAERIPASSRELKEKGTLSARLDPCSISAPKQDPGTPLLRVTDS